MALSAILSEIPKLPLLVSNLLARLELQTVSKGTRMPESTKPTDSLGYGLHIIG